MKRPKCTCGAVGVGSHVHTLRCDVTHFERQERLMPNLFMDQEVKFKPFVESEPTIEELMEEQKSKFYLTYRWKGNA